MKGRKQENVKGEAKEKGVSGITITWQQSLGLLGQGTETYATKK
jgi:hypothetical protein